MNIFNLSLKIKSIGVAGSFTPAYSSAQKREVEQAVMAPGWVNAKHPLISREETDLDWEDIKEVVFGPYLNATVCLTVAIEFNPFKNWGDQEERIYAIEIDGKTSVVYYKRVENCWKKIKDSHSK